MADWTKCTTENGPRVVVDLFTRPIGEGFTVFHANIVKDGFDIEWRNATTLVIRYTDGPDTNIIVRETVWGEVRIEYQN